MKSVNIFAIVSVILVLIILAVTLFFVLGNRNDKKPVDDTTDIFDCLTIDDLKDYIKDNKIKTYYFETDSCYIESMLVLGVDAVVEFSFQNNYTSQIKATYQIFECVDENAEEDNLKQIDVKSYQFTKKDKETIQEGFNKVKSGLEEKLGCKLEKYSLIPTREGLKIDDSEEEFYDGSFVREYSVRDKDGKLWILRFEASYGYSRATLIKLINDSEYDGFVPTVDITTKGD